MSPISLLEFGLHARSGKMVVFCPEGFWRKGNVDIVCERYGIPQVEEMEELVTLIRYSPKNKILVDKAESCAIVPKGKLGRDRFMSDIG